MPCSRCGMPCQGRKCRTCEDADHQEDYYGTSADLEDVDEDDDDDQDDEWAVVQQGLDGQTHTGQSTLDGGVSKDGGDS